MDRQLVDMEEASPETEGLKDVVMGDSTLGALENEHHKVKKKLWLLLAISDDVPFVTLVFLSDV